MYLGHAQIQAFIFNFAAKEKIGEVKKVLQKAADTNKRKLPELDITPQVGRFKSQNIFWIQVDVASASPLDLFHPLPIFIRSMVMFFNWLVTTMCYYGLTSAAATLTPDLYLNFTLVILVEVS